MEILSFLEWRVASESYLNLIVIVEQKKTTWISFVNNEKVYINLKNCKNKVNDISFIVLIMLINSMFISICDSTRQQHMQLSLIGCLT